MPIIFNKIELTAIILAAIFIKNLIKLIDL